MKIFQKYLGAGVTRRPPSRRQTNWSTVNSSTERSKLKTGRKFQLVDGVSVNVNWSTGPTGQPARQGLPEARLAPVSLSKAYASSGCDNI
jgi:hypothetical protein